MDYDIRSPFLPCSVFPLSYPPSSSAREPTRRRATNWMMGQMRIMLAPSRHCHGRRRQVFPYSGFCLRCDSRHFCLEPLSLFAFEWHSPGGSSFFLHFLFLASSSKENHFLRCRNPLYMLFQHMYFFAKEIENGCPGIFVCSCVPKAQMATAFVHIGWFLRLPLRWIRTR